ncbi:MAG TPA: 50S ribosomal protein L10 [Solirubrobacterales bacterium]|nr:50S ribosomal protein L10 [Solirubrobacterales bacterium]
MNKEEKAAAVEEIAQRLGEAEAIFAVDYRGISVTEAAELRSSLREADATFRVVKNRLAKRAAEQAGTNELQDLLDGPIALTFIKGDAVIAAKAIATFARQHDVLEYRGGIMDGEPLDPEKFGAIARLPGLDVLHGQLVGVTASPLTGLTRGLAAMISGLAVGLGQIAEKGLVGGGDEPAAAEAKAEEPQAEETVEEPEAEEPAAEEEPEAEVKAEEEAPETSSESETEEAPEGSESEGSDSEGSEEAKEE